MDAEQCRKPEKQPFTSEWLLFHGMDAGGHAGGGINMNRR